MLCFFTTTVTTLALVIFATAYTALAQDGSGRDPGHTTRVSIGTCYDSYHCVGKGRDVQGTTNGSQHVGCNGFWPKFPIHAICTSSDCSSKCQYIEDKGGWGPGYCVWAADLHEPVGCVKL